MGKVTYTAFLSWLIAFGSALPGILAKIQAGVAEFMGAAELVKGTLPEAVFEVSDEDTALEGQVAQLVATDNAVFDGSKLRAAWKFLNDSGLLPVIISLLTKAA